MIGANRPVDRDVVGTTPVDRVILSMSGHRPAMFFFSNRIGCLGSLLLSATATAILIVVLSR